MSRDGVKKAFIVIPILLALGCLTAMWMASGTVAAFVYYGLSFISPPLFLLIAFLASSAVSVLLGSSLGSVGTVGVILMALARGGNVDPYLTAGVIISAAYVGDRCSPIASALFLLSAVTETDAYRNIRMALITTVGPFLLTALLYLPLSLLNPLVAGETALRQEIAQYFHIGLLPLAPAIIIVVLCCVKADVTLSMLISALSAGLIAFFAQGLSLPSLLSALFTGFEPMPGSSLAAIIHGGGLVDMLKASFILLSACALSGILLGLDAMRGLDKLLAKPCGRLTLYLKTLAVSMLGICCGCTQSIAIVISGQVMLKPYELNGLNRDDLARDISFTALPLAAAVPWCVASMVPTAALGVPPARHLIWLFYPVILPLWYGVIYAKGQRASHNT
jgi:NhaC family Na+:H+ antiporter